MNDQLAATFELVATVSSDGYLARYSGEDITTWTSREDQDRFFKCFESKDFAFMGRVTHEQNFKPERWRVVFSTEAQSPQWRHDRHLWVDPNRHGLEEIVQRASERAPCRTNLILGATGVHDWFLRQDRIDRIQMSIEPVTFDDGLPLFGTMSTMPPQRFLEELGFTLVQSEQLNALGSWWHILERQGRSLR